MRATDAIRSLRLTRLVRGPQDGGWAGNEVGGERVGETRGRRELVSRGNAVLLNNDEKKKTLTATFIFIHTFLHHAPPRPST